MIIFDQLVWGKVYFYIWKQSIKVVNTQYNEEYRLSYVSSSLFDNHYNPHVRELARNDFLFNKKRKFLYVIKASPVPVLIFSGIEDRTRDIKLYLNYI